MKKSMFTALVAAAGLALSATASHAQVTFTAGDILLGFQASGGTGAGQTYVFNLGSGAHYRDNPTIGFGNANNFVFNIGTDLGNTFGPGWYSRTDLKMGIGGVRTNATFGANASSIVDGDPARALYVGRGTLTPGAGALWNLGTASTVNAGATDIVSMQSGFEGKTATANSGNRGIIQGTGDINSWNDYVTFNGASFGVFTAGLQQAFGTGGAYTYLDVQRVLSDAQGVGTVNPQTVGVGSYVTTFRIDETGDLSVVPEPSSALLLSIAGILGLIRRRRRVS